MDPKLLSQLREVVIQGSLSRAALSLNVTQPTLTRNMKAIEEIVGAPVLRRGRYGVTPTSLGERLSEQGRIVSSAMSMADETIEQWRTGLVGEVRLGVGTMLCASLMPSFFAANPLKDSNFTIRVIAAKPIELMQQLRNKEIVMTLTSSHSKSVIGNVTQEVMYTDEICVMAGSRSPLIHSSSKIAPHFLLDQTWITINNLARTSYHYDQAPLFTGIDKIVPKFRFDGDVAAPMAMLRDSAMLAIAPKQFAKSYAALGGIHILDIDGELPKREIVLRVCKEHEDDTNVMELSKMIKNYFYNFDFSNEQGVKEIVEVKVMDIS